MVSLSMLPLAALGYMRGEGSQRAGKDAQRRFVDVVVDAVCGCRDDAVDDIQHAMINTLLVAITSNVFQVPLAWHPCAPYR